MKKKYSTKRALIASILALCMCFSMLVGTTFAWFTDEVTSSNNIIKSGSLEIALEKWEDSKWVDASTGPIFNYDKWEPGYTQVVNLRVRNLGTLALKWQAVITTEKNLSILADVINVYVRSGKVEADVKVSTDARIADLDAGNFTKYTLREFINSVGSINKGNLKEKNESDYLGIVLAMDTAAGNEYQNLDLGGKFNLTILATQDTVEKDSFDNLYDELAKFSYVASGNLPVEAGKSDYEIKLLNPNGGTVGSAIVESESVADNAKELSVTVIETKPNANVTVETDQGARTFEINAYGLDENNTTPVKVQLNIGTGYTGVKLYHYTDEITGVVYNPDKGDLIFYTDSFSPFTVVFDAAGAEVDEPSDTTKLQAIVKDKDEYELTNLEWEPFGPFSALPVGYQLESVYEFSAPHDSTTVKESIYKDWYCDYYVMMDRDVEEGALVLGGNYGEFGWVGFESPAAPGKTEIPLLGAALDPENPRVDVMTYEAVVNFVQVFLCGVAHLDESLNGATFTVSLRLTDPDNYDKYFDAAVVKYTFDDSIVKRVEASSTADLSAAVEGGATSIVLGAGEIKMPSSTTNSNITISGTKDTVIDVTKGAYMDSANVTIEGVTIKTSTGYVMDDAGNTGADYAALYSPNTTYVNCTFDGPMRVGRDGAKFINCTFTNLGNDYVWTYGNDVTFEGCTFETDGKAILIYSDGGNEISKVTVKNCTFNATASAKAGAIANQSCAAIEIHNYGNGVDLVTEGNTIDPDFSGEWRIKTYETGRTQVFVNETEYTTIAIDGKKMTIDSSLNVTVIG